jgi:hypothetical protein
MGLMKTTAQSRDRGNGQYAHSADRLCKCGHRLGEHAAEVVDGERPCFHGHGEDCECVKFTPAKKK